LNSTTRDMAAKQLTLEEARAAITEAVATLTVPENLQKMNEVRAAAGPDIIKLMTTVTPVALSIISGILAKYGFDPTQPAALMQFVAAVQAHSADPEISQQASQLKAQLLPPNFQIPPMFTQPPK